MLIRQMYVEPTVSRTALFADGLRDSELKKSASNMVTVPVVEQTALFVKKLIEEDPRITIREICGRCDV